MDSLSYSRSKVNRPITEQNGIRGKECVNCGHFIAIDLYTKGPYIDTLTGKGYDHRCRGCKKLVNQKADRQALVPVQQYRDVPVHTGFGRGVQFTEGGPLYVAIADICDFFGVASQNQVERLSRDPNYRSALEKGNDTIGFVGSAAWFIRADKVAGWLHLINPNKVKEGQRDGLIAYRDVCDQVLNNYMTGTPTAPIVTSQPTEAIVMRRLDSVECKVDQVLEWTTSVDKVQRTIRLRGGLYLARFRDEELSNPASLLAEYGIKDAAHWLTRHYMLVTIGKSSKETPKRVAKHSGKLPVYLTKLEATFEIDDPDTGENYLRNNPPPYPTAYKVRQGALKDWFWLRRDVLDEIKVTWPHYVTIADMTAHCKGWAFSSVVHAYAQEELF